MMRVKFFASNDIRRLSSRLCYSTATTKTKPVAEIVTGYKEKPSVSEIKADYIGKNYLMQLYQLTNCYRKVICIFFPVIDRRCTR